MPTTPIKDFLDTMHAKFPNLKSYDETRLYSVLMEVGFEVEFNVTEDGGTTVTYADITDDVAAKLSKV